MDGDQTCEPRNEHGKRVFLQTAQVNAQVPGDRNSLSADCARPRNWWWTDDSTPKFRSATRCSGSSADWFAWPYPRFTAAFAGRCSRGWQKVHRNWRVCSSFARLFLLAPERQLPVINDAVTAWTESGVGGRIGCDSGPTPNHFRWK